ncbi:uncharacterized protein LOC114246780 [Bombyx mandarina]|uniref:Uncharacterized protein LOC114246780 n=1 Tax=Bombyx mandarina TaxID=7092 RepID=A0A6J2K0R4_BOMMA|nr:uncharacterized protein LOC114246780 [Bombyx mandarina]
MSKKPLRSQARNIVFNFYQRILVEQGAEQTQSSILSHVQALTGVSNTTIRRIVARSNRGVFSKPGKKRKGGKNTAPSSSSSSDEDFFMDVQYLNPFSSSDSL